MIFKTLNLIFKPMVSRHFKFIEISQGTRFAYFRVKPKGENILNVGENSIIEANLIYECVSASISIGKNTFVGRSNLTAASGISIGDDVLISWGVNIVDHNSHSIAFSKRRSDVSDWFRGEKNWKDVLIRPVKICDKSWIGFNSIILKGVTVGEGSIVGAGSVVTKDVAPWTIVAGNPARVIREISEDER